jgi:hypothetical protein
VPGPGNLDRLRAFAPRPQLVVYSGSGGAHAYWRLAVALPARELEAVNRKLAHHLGADLCSTDRARIMRLPGTHNHKANRPCRLVLCDLASPPVDAERLVAGLEDPDPPPPPPSAAELRRRVAFPAADEASRIPPPVYFGALAGVEVPRSGFVQCPSPEHPDELASCRVWAEPERGWFCFGCGAGGGGIDLASVVSGGPWGRELRGGGFKQARRRFMEAVGIGEGG